MLTRWSPFLGLSRDNGSTVPSLFDTFFSDPMFRADVQTDGAQWLAPAADVIETKDDVQLKVDLPGHDPKSVKLTVEGDTLTLQSERKAEKQEKGESYVRSERRFGTYLRSFVLPENVDGSRAEARFEHGVLTVKLPKKEEAKPKTINIHVEG